MPEDSSLVGRRPEDDYFSRTARFVIERNQKELVGVLDGRSSIESAIARHLERRGGQKDARPIKEALDPDDQKKIQSGTKANIIAWIVDELGSDAYWPLLWDHEWRRWPKFQGCETIEDAVERIESGSLANEATMNSTTLASRLPMTQSDVGALAGTYVTYRYALESTPDNPFLAREVIRVGKEPVNGCLDFRMAYRMPGTDDETNPLKHQRDHKQFLGSVQTFGESYVFTSVHLETDDAERTYREDRVRFIIMPVLSTDLKPLSPRFGLMTTTRAMNPYDSCAICIVMIPLQFDLPEQDFLAFEEHVTRLSDIKEIMNNDFGALSEQQKDYLQDFLSNTPMTNSQEQTDLVVKLHYDRFNFRMKEIIPDIQRGKATAFRKSPFCEGWRDG